MIYPQKIRTNLVMGSNNEFDITEDDIKYGVTVIKSKIRRKRKTKLIQGLRFLGITKPKVFDDYTCLRLRTILLS